jgi:hypothetical protein
MLQRTPKAKVKVVSAPKSAAPQKLVKDAQSLLILLVFFELHTTQTKSEKDIFVKATKYYEQNVQNFVNKDIDARSDEGVQFLQSKERYLPLTSVQLLKAKASGANFNGKQLWVKAKEIRRYILNQITPVFNSFLQNPGDIFPSGWEIEDMLEATRRKMYADSRATTALNLTDEAEDDEEGQQHADPLSSLDNSLVDELPNTFPTELRTIVVPAHWQPSFWQAFLWFGKPCEYLYSGRSAHPQLLVTFGNGPDPDESNDIPAAIIKKEGLPSLSRSSQKRKANAEAAAENEGMSSGSTSNCGGSFQVIDRELDLAERVQKRDEADRVLTLLKENLVDADNTPDKLLARTQIKLYRERMILSMTT